MASRSSGKEFPCGAHPANNAIFLVCFFEMKFGLIKIRLGVGGARTYFPAGAGADEHVQRHERKTATKCALLHSDGIGM